jgi:predicted dehydrogenase/threonine dehydrogenase-like Zn-dependent dehydrogenase
MAPAHAAPEGAEPVLQVLQSLSTGAIEVADVAAPKARPGAVLIETRASLISAGTERMLLDFGRANLIDKALQQPEKVKQTLEKVRTDGVVATLEAVRSKLDQPLPLGYCNAGVVLDVGAGVSEFSVGDRVLSNGAHAEIAAIPRLLCARIPDNVPDDDACFAVLGAIGLQGVRLAAPSLGEKVCVLGLGLIGLMTVQILKAAGCQVIGADFDKSRLAMAAQFGAETIDLSAGQDPVARAMAFTGGRGIDAVFITAATKSNDPVQQAARMSRKRGRIILVGVAGLELDRADFYEKELTFQVSCSYGPGRYDSDYEQKGRDYPFGFVRWTEQRNFEAVLDLMASGALNVEPLISHRVSIAEANVAYDKLHEGEGLGIVLTYPQRPIAEKTKRVVSLAAAAKAAPGARIGVIGAGNYASRVLIPALTKAGASIRTVASQAGLTAVIHGRKAGAEQATSDVDTVFADPEIDAVVIATRHDSHAGLTVRAIEAGKHVFVEKPLALTHDELDEIESAVAAARARSFEPIISVGFNRRFAPHAIAMKAALDRTAGPKCLTTLFNAGDIPADHWTQDAQAGGGRILGEACHHIDLLRFLIGAEIVNVAGVRIGRASGAAVRDDKATINFTFADGSIATIHYFANGSKAFPKERIEAFAGGRTFVLDNFKSLKGYGAPGFKTVGGFKQDKGNEACAAAFVAAVREGRPAPVPLAEVFDVSRASVRAAQFAD